MFIQYRCLSSNASILKKTSTIFPVMLNNNSNEFSSNILFENNIMPIGSCDSIAFSPYTPLFLNQSNSISFEYSINQQITCTGSTSVLICPLNTVIHIYAAYFGIQSATLIKSCFISSSDLPECYFTQSFDYINSSWYILF
jgi:hypothetical protein